MHPKHEVLDVMGGGCKDCRQRLSDTVVKTRRFVAVRNVTKPCHQNLT